MYLFSGVSTKRFSKGWDGRCFTTTTGLVAQVFFLSHHGALPQYYMPRLHQK